MSHTQNIKIDITDADILVRACNRLKIRQETNRNVEFFDKTVVLGTAVYLPGWMYPAVVTPYGTVVYDNMDGLWGKTEELHKLEAVYGLEKAKKEALKAGYSAWESYDEKKKEYYLTITT